MKDLDRDRDLAGAARAHRTVISALEDLTDDQVRQPSRLPGWTVGHVVAHIVGNANGHRRMIEAAIRSEVTEMYPGGREQRTNDIEALAQRTAAELIAEVIDSAAQLEASWAKMPSSAWAGRAVMLGGEATIADLPFIRWREVSVHHADLGLGYSWSDWDEDYVRLELVRLTMSWSSRKPMGMTGLPPEALSVPPHHRVAWLLGRAEIDGLAPAGIIT
ncbi:MAG: maleylpyruvate isomerase [Ilumatobacteraceae bacterium]